MAVLHKRRPGEGLAKERRSLEAAWVAARNTKNCLCYGGVGGMAGFLEVQGGVGAMAPWHAIANWEGAGNLSVKLAVRLPSDLLARVLRPRRLCLFGPKPISEEHMR